MKALNKNILIILVVFLSACGKDFLEVAPKGSFVASKTIDYENLLYNSFPIGFDVPSVGLGDDVATLTTYFDGSPLRLQRIFRWEADFYDPEQSASELQVPISSIYIYNKIINEVMNSQDGDDNYKKRILAEAKASRAHFNQLLINYYGKPYNSSSSNTDLGIPLVKKADASEKLFTRATVAEVYENMIQDLLEAIPLLPVNQPNRLRMTKSAAEFTLAKLYWYQGKYSAALDLIKQGKTHLPSSFENGIYDYNQTYSVPSWSVASGYNNIESLLARVSICTWVNSSNNLVLAPWVLALYSSTDKRLKSFSNVPYLGTGVFPGGLVRRIGPYGSSVTQGVTLPDIELIKAECEARLNNLSDCRTTLIAFRSKRMASSEAQVSLNDKESLVRFVVDERVREFALYGYRWFDMRRLSNDPLFKDNVYKHIKYSGQTGSPAETYTLDPLRLTLRFPISVIAANPNMPNNP